MVRRKVKATKQRSKVTQPIGVDTTKALLRINEVCNAYPEWQQLLVHKVLAMSSNSSLVVSSPACAIAESHMATPD